MSFKESVDIAVIGAGPAGLAAAIEAAKAKARVVVFDENLSPGGQLFKQIHKFFGSREHLAGTRGYRIGEMLLKEASEAGVEIRLGTVVYGVFEPLTLGLVNGDKSWACSARAIVVATGAMENTMAFPGWTLPGVMGAGAAQTMVNIHRVLPGRKVLMVGSGNVGLIVTYQLLQAGAEVAAIVEAADKIGGYGVHASKVRRAGVPILLSHTVKEAYGNGQVEGATVVKLDRQWHPIPGTERSFDVDTICVAVGLSPLAELLWMMGVEFTWDGRLGGHVPLHDEDMRTTMEGVYVAGDVTGIEEASSAMEEGRLAGIAAAEHLGYLDPAEALRRKEAVRARLDALRSGPFGQARKEAKLRLVEEFRRKYAGAGEKATVSAAGGAGGATGAAPEASNAAPASKVASPQEPEARGVARTGYPSPEELSASPGVPSMERLKKGKVAVIECVQEIPCNPCEEACPHGAIKVGTPITNLPALDAEKCVGCGLCIPKCPGLAIFTVDLSLPGEEALVELPWEYLPLPEKGQLVQVLNREGIPVGRGRVTAVRKSPKFDKTVVLQVRVPKELAMEVRAISRDGQRPS